MKGAAAPQSAGDLAAWPTHQRAAGKGRSLLFGFYANTYPYDRMKARGEWLRRPLGEFLAAAGAAPSVRVAAADKTFQPVTVVCYRDGDALYAALQRDYMVADPSPRDFTVAAGAPAHLYDVRAGRYLGRTDRATLNLEVARGAMLAFLPYRAVEVQTDGLRQMYHQGEVVQFRAGLQVEGGKPGRGVYRVEVLNPAGERVLPLCRKVRSQGGVAEVALPLAFNDPAGKWTLRVADVATGLSVERPLEVAPAGP